MLQGGKVEVQALIAFQATRPDGHCPLFSSITIIAQRIFFAWRPWLVNSVRRNNNSFLTLKLTSQKKVNTRVHDKLILCKYLILIRICSCRVFVWFLCFLLLFFFVIKKGWNYQNKIWKGKQERKCFNACLHGSSYRKCKYHLVLRFQEAFKCRLTQKGDDFLNSNLIS